jgi:hypothetical protein
VWENLGWWYAVQTEDGFMKVHPVTHLGKVCAYTAFLGEGPGGTWAENGETPAIAIEAVIKRAEASAKHTLHLLESYRTVTLSPDEIRLKRSTPKTRRNT